MVNQKNLILSFILISLKNVNIKLPLHISKKNDFAIFAMTNVSLSGGDIYLLSLFFIKKVLNNRLPYRHDGPSYPTCRRRWRSDPSGCICGRGPGVARRESGGSGRVSDRDDPRQLLVYGPSAVPGEGCPQSVKAAVARALWSRYEIADSAAQYLVSM